MINNFSKIDIFEEPKMKSKLSSQMLYGEKFKIIYTKNNWIKIKTSYDNYIGYIKNKKFSIKANPTLKVNSLKSEIFKKLNGKFRKTNQFLYFASRISKLRENNKFLEFEKNKWIKKKDTKNIDHYEKNFVKVLKLFLNSTYLWGGKTSKGIDCSALIQIYFYYNRIFFPRDSKDQSKFCKKKLRKKFIKGDIIFWNGHVGICINNLKFIHAYGPRKKVLIMRIDYAIKLIERTARLFIKKISNIKNY